MGGAPLKKIPLINGRRIIYTGKFNTQKIYEDIIDFLENKEKFKVFELDFSNNFEDKERSLGVNIQAVKEIDDFAIFEFNFHLTILGTKIGEVKKIDGVEYEMERGSLKLSLNGTLTLDWQGKNDSSPMYRFFFQKIMSPYFTNEKAERHYIGIALGNYRNGLIDCLKKNFF